MNQSGDAFPGERGLLVAAWVVAAVATLGSLTYSNVLGFHPCHLCWYQRIFMYPLPLVLGYALLVRRPDVYPLALAFSVPGGVIAAYHSYLQFTPSARCTALTCSTVYVRVVGLSIPNQSLLAFVLVTAALGWIRRVERRSGG